MAITPRIVAATVLSFALCPGISCERKPPAGNPAAASNTIESHTHAAYVAKYWDHAEEALTGFQKALALADKDKVPLQWINLAAIVGYSLFEQGRAEEAKTLYREILFLQKENPGEVPSPGNFLLGNLELLFDTEKYIEEHRE